jgi:hypothetical protein
MKIEIFCPLKQKVNSKLDLTGMDDPGYAISKFNLKV